MKPLQKPTAACLFWSTGAAESPGGSSWSRTPFSGSTGHLSECPGSIQQNQNPYHIPTQIQPLPVTLQNLPLCAALAVDAGLDTETAWRAITITPAVSTGIGDRVGSLEVGKDADVVIWTADPMTTVGAKAYTTIVDGKVVWQA